jgi:hypothetical protein
MPIGSDWLVLSHMLTTDQSLCPGYVNSHYLDWVMCLSSSLTGRKTGTGVSLEQMEDGQAKQQQFVIPL